MKDILLTLYDYNYWANTCILNAAARLDETQFRMPADYPHGGVRGTLVHMLSGECIWRQRCQEGISPTTLLTENDFPTLTSLTGRWHEEEAKMRRYLNALSEAELQGTVSYKTTAGRPQAQRLDLILHHLILHGMQHRAEVAAMLTGFGHSPGDVDLIVYLRKKS